MGTTGYLHLQDLLLCGSAFDWWARHFDRLVLQWRAGREGDGGVVDLCGGRRGWRLIVASASQPHGCRNEPAVGYPTINACTACTRALGVWSGG